MSDWQGGPPPDIHNGGGGGGGYNDRRGGGFSRSYSREDRERDRRDGGDGSRRDDRGPPPGPPQGNYYRRDEQDRGGGYRRDERRDDRRERDDRRDGGRDNFRRDERRDDGPPRDVKRKRSQSPPRSYDPSKRQKTGWDMSVPAFGGPPVEGGAPGAPAMTPGAPGAPGGMPFPFMMPYIPNQSTRQARRLYVGNLPPGVTEQQLMDFMNDKIMNSNYERDPALGAPVYLAEVNNDKSYAFVEFKTPKDAAIGMAHDGITLFGQALRIRRPKDYVPSGSEDEIVHMKADSGIISTNVADTPHKLYIGGIPTHLTEEDIKQLLGVFGRLRAFNLVRDSQTSASKGFAFCEYVDTGITDTVVNKLNGMKVGDKTLAVARAMLGRMADGTVGGDAFLAVEPTNKTAAALLNLLTPVTQLLASFQISGAMIPPSEPTRILVILNAVNIVDDWSDDYYEEVLEDFEVESRRFGRVRSVLIPRPEKKKPDEPQFLRPLSAEEYQAKQREEEAQAQEEASKKQQAMEDIMALIKKEKDHVGEPGAPAPVPVEQVLIPEIPEDPRFKEPVWGFGKVFIEYETTEEAARAQRDFAGRRFDGRMLITSFYPENQYPPRGPVVPVVKAENGPQ